jgi:hypothetical protein
MQAPSVGHSDGVHSKWQQQMAAHPNHAAFGKIVKSDSSGSFAADHL